MDGTFEILNCFRLNSSSLVSQKFMSSEEGVKVRLRSNISIGSKMVQIIGITSLYLYDNSPGALLQDGKIHKLVTGFLRKREKREFLSNFR